MISECLERVRFAVEKKFISKVNLARMAGVNPSIVTRIMQGGDCTSATLDKLHKGLNDFLDVNPEAKTEFVKRYMREGK